MTVSVSQSLNFCEEKPSTVRETLSRDTGFHPNLSARSPEKFGFSSDMTRPLETVSSCRSENHSESPEGTKMKNILTVAFLLSAATAKAGAQDTIKLQLEPGTELSISGTSTVHAFTCKTSKIDATLVVDRGYTKDLTRIPKPIVNVRVEIPAKSLDCGNGKMNNNMYGTLKADENPMITYVLSGYDLDNATATGFAAKTTGQLTIAGKEKTVAMEVKADRVEETKATAKGEQSILLTDFGIKPPSFMLGALKVGNEIKIRFNLKAGPAMIAMVSAAITGEATH